MTQRTIAHTLRLAAFLLAACAACARAQATYPAVEARIGGFFVHSASKSDDLSGPFTVPGINLRVGDSSGVYLAGLVHLDANWDLSVEGGIPPTVKSYGRGPAKVGSVPFDGQDLGSAKWFSPTLLVHYTFLDAKASPLRPFVGVGINHTRFYKLESTAAGDAANGGPTRTTLSSSWGPVGSVGATWQVTGNIDVTASYSLARVNSHFSADTAGVVRTTTIHFNPRAAVLAAGFTF